jgi:PAS domain S-box-containing protein
LLTRPILVLAVTCGMIVSLQGWIEWRARVTQVQETNAYLINLASSLAQHAEDTIEVADTALIGLVERIQTDGTSPEAVAHLNRKLEAQIAAKPRHAAITVLDANGNWLASSSPAQRGNFADRDYFRHHRDDPSPAPFLGPPILSRLTGNWIITVSRRFHAPGGGFGGVVLAAINLSYFTNYYATYDLGANSAIGLISGDGIMLARYPPSQQFVGQTILQAMLFTKLRDHAVGSYQNTSLIDGVPRFFGYRQSQRYPLIVTAAISRDQALGAWRAGALLDMAIALVLTGAISLLGVHLSRQMRRSQAAEEELRASEQRYRLLLESGGVTDALYMLDPDGNIQTWNAGAQRIKGYTANEIIGQNFRKFFTPDDIAKDEPSRLLALARQQGRLTAEGWRLRKNGERFLAKIIIDAIRRPDGSLLGFAKVRHHPAAHRGRTACHHHGGSAERHDHRRRSRDHHRRQRPGGKAVRLSAWHAGGPASGDPGARQPARRTRHAARSVRQRDE